MSIKKRLSIGLLLCSLISVPALAADYSRFVSPSSLGQNVNTLNSKHQLGLQEISEGYYKNSDSYNCEVFVTVDGNNKIDRITISRNNSNCHYQVASSGISFDNKSTSVVDVLNQAKIEEVHFEPGCFNCPSRIELNDELVIQRPQDNYRTKIGIDGYNTEYLEFMAKTLFGNYSKNDYYPMMDKLEEKLRDNPSLYNRKDFKLKAIKTYNLKSSHWDYTIALK